MNKALTTKETNELLSATRPPMTRSEKLQRWAGLIRATLTTLALYDRLEHRIKEWDMLSHSGTAFALAAADPVFREAGLKSGSVGDAVRFFELSPEEIHAFSCNCGGQITKEEMANRIDKIARGPTAAEAVITEMAKTVGRLMTGR